LIRFPTENPAGENKIKGTFIDLDDLGEDLAEIQENIVVGGCGGA